MQYVLGNMLNGGGGLNADGLALDLQFAADKTLTARRGPTPTFTRSSGNNGGTTYFGPLVDYANIAFSTTGVSNGRASWFKSEAGEDITISYTGARWRIHTISGEFESEYLAAVGSEWRPDQANWSASGAFSPVTTSSTFGIVKAANDEPRFDHDPVTLACKGLLIEESRTNLLQRSEEFGDAYWEKVRATISADQTASPTGQTTADKLINDTTASNNHRVDRGSLSLNLNTVYTVSVFAKASEYSGLALGVDPSNPITGVQFSLSGSGSVTAQNAGYTGTIQNFGNGWFRCTATFTSSSTVPNHRLYMYVGQNGTTFSYTGDGTSGIFIWGAQLEAGAFATSYIPTTTGTLARGADVCSITGGNFTSFYNQSEGTFLLKATSLMATATGGNRTFVSFTDGGYINQQGLYKATNTNNLSFPIGAGIGPAIGTLTAGSPFAVSGAMQVANNAAAFNGAAAVAVTGSAATGISKLEFRDPTAAATGHPTMHISQFRYYKKRLPNAKLQALTV
jgi:hypothetical protein